jgi:hypothetical protein
MEPRSIDLDGNEVTIGNKIVDLFLSWKSSQQVDQLGPINWKSWMVFASLRAQEEADGTASGLPDPWRQPTTGRQPGPYHWDGGRRARHRGAMANREKLKMTMWYIVIYHVCHLQLTIPGLVHHSQLCNLSYCCLRVPPTDCRSNGAPKLSTPMVQQQFLHHFSWTLMVLPGSTSLLRKSCYETSLNVCSCTMRFFGSCPQCL